MNSMGPELPRWLFKQKINIWEILFNILFYSKLYSKYLFGKFYSFNILLIFIVLLFIRSIMFPHLTLFIFIFIFISIYWTLSIFS